VPFSTDREWWESHADDMLSLMNRESRDGEPKASSAARAVVKDDAGDDKDRLQELFRAMFDVCDTDGCNRGCNGFHTDYCGKPDHKADTADSSDDTADTDDDVSLDDLSDDDKEKLVSEVLDSL